MSTDNTDKAQDKEEDYDVSKEQLSQPKQQCKPYQRDRGERRPPRQGQGYQPRGGDRQQQQYGQRRQHDEEGEELYARGQQYPRGGRRDRESSDDEQIAYRSKLFERQDPENDAKSRFLLPEEFSAEEMKQRNLEDIEYYNSMEKEFKAPVNYAAQEYRNSEWGKLQNELMALIKEKVDTGDRQKAKVFVSKIRQLAESTSTLKIDSGTLSKIEELFVNRHVKSEEELLASGHTDYNQIDEQVLPSLSERTAQDFIPGRDTFKDEPITFEDYNQFVFDSMVDMNNMENFHNADLQEHPYEVLGTQDEYSVGNQQEEDFDLLVQDRREEIMGDFEEGTVEEIQELVKIQDQYSDPNAPPIDEHFRSFGIILNSITAESTTFQIRIDAQQKEILRQKSINHDTKDDNNLPLETQQLNERQKQEIGQALQQQEELTSDFNNEIEEELKMQFDQNKHIMRYNTELRRRLVSQVRQARNQLRNAQMQRDKLTSRLESLGKEMATDAIPGGIFDFTKLNKSINKKQQLKVLNDLFKDRRFTESSTEVSDYNNELHLLIKLHEAQKSQDKPKTIQMIGKVFNLMKQNKVQGDEVTNIRIFEYAVITKNQELANQKLRDHIKNDLYQGLQVIDTQLLKKFYKQSLKSDNFTGVAHLLNYVEKQQLDISHWSLSQFQSALNFYLNHTFDLTKLLTFSRYYTYLNDCRLEKVLQQDYEGKAIDQLTDIQKKELHFKVFRESDSLIDMRSLFSVLVDKVGQKDAVDPFTKQDVLWNLIDFFTRRGMADLMQKGENNYSSLSERDIAKYFKNHINSTKAFERATHVILRFDGRGETFQNALIQLLKEYQATNNGSMPYSFEPMRVRSTYGKLLNAQQSMNAKFGEKTAEYFLEVFSALKMWPEVNDLCTNFEKFTGQSAENSELRRHYQTNALLKINSDKHYHQVVQQTVYNNKEELSPGYITSMTKAYLQDGSLTHGVKFFAESIQKLGEMRKNREDYLVTMFDKAFGEEAAKELTYDQFKQKYLQTILMSEQSLKEAKAYTTLKEAFQDKNYQQIENLFSLFIVAKEEKALLEEVRQGMTVADREKFTIDKLMNTDINEIESKYLTEAGKQRIMASRMRHQALKDQMEIDDYNRVLEIKEIMGDDKFKVLSGLKSTSADDIQALFNIRNKAEITEMIRKSSIIYEAARHMTPIQHMTTLTEFHETVEDGINHLDEIMNGADEDLTNSLANSYKDNKSRGKSGQIIDNSTAAQAAADGGDVDEEGKKFKDPGSYITKEDVDKLQRQLRISQQELDSVTDEQMEQMLNEELDALTASAGPETTTDEDEDDDDEDEPSLQEEEAAELLRRQGMDARGDDQIQKTGDQMTDADLQEEADEDDDDYEDESEELEIPHDLQDVFPTRMTLTQQDVESLKEDPNFTEELIEEAQALVGKTIDFRREMNPALDANERIDPTIMATLRNLYSGKFPPPQERIDEAMDEAILHNFDMYEDDKIDDDFDETVLKQDTHNLTLNEMKEELLKAINHRKKDVLEIAISIFNNIQDKKAPMKKLNQLDRFNEKSAEEVEIGNTLEMCEKLLQDQRSPLISALNTFAQYKENQIETSFNDVFDELEEDMHDAVFDIEFEMLSQRHLTALNEKMRQTNEGLRVITQRLLAENNKLNEQRQVKETQRKKKEQQEKVNEQLERRIKNLYDQYQQKVQNTKNVDFANDLSREAKLDLLSDLFAAEYDNTFTNNLFPAYYSQDLIIFGLENNIPEAIRLGEQMMSQNGQTLPREMQIAVREYLLSNHEKYRNAMKNTGPIDNASLYKSVNNARRFNGKSQEQPVMMVADDPYWQIVMRTTYKRSEAWKRPSLMAYDYKRYGIFSEIAPHLTEDYVKKQEQYMQNMF